MRLALGFALTSCATIPSARITRSVASVSPGTGVEASASSPADDRFGALPPISDAVAIIAAAARLSAIVTRIAPLRSRDRSLRTEVLAPDGDRHPKRSDVRASASSVAGGGGLASRRLAIASVGRSSPGEPSPADASSVVPKEAVTGTWLSMAAVRRCPRSSLRRRRTSRFGGGEASAWRHLRASGIWCSAGSGRSEARARPVICPVSRSVSYHSSVPIAPAPSASCGNRLRTEPLTDRSSGPVPLPVPVRLLIGDPNTLASMMSDNVKPALGP